eukprot:scaffold9905_cov117-Isochrysis_galbana.AAC.18
MLATASWQRKVEWRVVGLKVGSPGRLTSRLPLVSWATHRAFHRSIEPSAARFRKGAFFDRLSQRERNRGCLQLRTDPTSLPCAGEDTFSPKHYALKCPACPVHSLGLGGAKRTGGLDLDWTLNPPMRSDSPNSPNPPSPPPRLKPLHSWQLPTRREGGWTSCTTSVLTIGWIIVWGRKQQTTTTCKAIMTDPPIDHTQAREPDAPGTNDAKHRAPVHGHTGGVPHDKALSDIGHWEEYIACGFCQQSKVP